jgi:hypothetical protein
MCPDSSPYPVAVRTKTVVIAPEYYDELAVRIFEMKVISQLLGGECTDIAAIVLLLFVG